MKVAVQKMIDALKVLGTGKVDYVSNIDLHQANGGHLSVKSVTVVDLHTLHGIAGVGLGAFMMPIEELIGISIRWINLPEGVTDIPSAIAHEKKTARK